MESCAHAMFQIGAHAFESAVFALGSWRREPPTLKLSAMYIYIYIYIYISADLSERRACGIAQTKPK